MLLMFSLEGEQADDNKNYLNEVSFLYRQKFIGYL